MKFTTKRSFDPVIIEISTEAEAKDIISLVEEITLYPDLRITEKQGCFLKMVCQKLEENLKMVG